MDREEESNGLRDKYYHLTRNNESEISMWVFGQSPEGGSGQKQRSEFLVFGSDASSKGLNDSDG